MSTNLLTLLENAEHSESGWPKYQITNDWKQGRTAYGGLSAALCLDAAIKSADDLPPLRSAQITFVGPIAGDDNIPVEIEISLLRRGKSVTYIRASLHTEKGIATEAVFAFGSSRASHFDNTWLPGVDVVTPEQAEPFFPPDAAKLNMAPKFTQHFDTRLISGDRPISSSDQHEFFLWVRHLEHAKYAKAQLDPAVQLLALADMPPPAVLPMFKEFAPVSSMTWMLNFVDTPKTNSDGWWLMQSSAETAREGYSSQNMLIWNADGKLAVTGRQSVVVFY
ncbi:MAG: thioesterase family protein [Pseudomonadota bacterium]